VVEGELDPHIVYEVPPRSRLNIRAAAGIVRTLWPDSGPYLPIVELLEHHASFLGDGQAIVFDYRDRAEMGSNHGLSKPSERLIIIREDVYELACEGDGFSRLTIAHELGHVLLHPDATLERRINRGAIPAYRSSEWQANCFAGELLMPAGSVHLCRSIDDVMRIFGVSRQAAIYQFNTVYKREGLISAELPDE